MKLFTKIIAVVAMVAMSMSVGTAAESKKMGKKMPVNFRAVPMAKAEIIQKGETKMYCPKCGMTLPMFYKTNHAATVDGKVQQYCSIYCMIEVMNSGAKVTDPKVVDNTSLKFIDATKASYVVGSSKPATMAANISKYAFGTKAGAEEFAKKFGGKVMNYADTLAGAKADYDTDTKKKLMRQAKGAKKGQMIYKKKCKPITEKFTTAADAKAYIKANKSCGDLKGKGLQAVGLYLKDVK